MRLPNEEQQKNLRTLAEYLLSGDLEADFDMRTYGDIESIHRSENCGSVGCAVGHGPYAGIPKRKEEGWFWYAERVFGVYDSLLFQYLFSSEWKGYDNTPQGAANRILAFLEKVEQGTLTEEYLIDNTPFL
jgi:hypothetical protein